MRNLRAMDARARRGIAGLLFLMAIGLVGAIWRGDSLGQTAGYLLACVAGGGFVIGCYLWARSED